MSENYEENGTAEEIAEESPRAIPGQRIRVTMTDGPAFVVRISNRDYVAWDMTAPKHKWGKAEDVPFLAQTFVAWSAAKRAGHTSLKFEAFRDAADDVVKVDDDTEEGLVRPYVTGSPAWVLVTLAVATGIPFRAWLEEDDATVATALHYLDEIERRRSNGA